MAKVVTKEEKAAAAAAAKKTGGKAKASAASKAPAGNKLNIQVPQGNHTAAAAMAATLPVRGDDGAAAARRAALMSKIGTLKEHPKSIIANDYIERSFPTASIVIDEVLGIREIPAHGRMIQVHGEEHSGKSTLLYHFAGAYQRVWRKPVWIWDIEGQLKTPYLWQCGLDPDPSMTIIRQTTDANEILRNTFQMMGDGKDDSTCLVDYFIFDSVSCLIPPVTDMDIAKDQALKHQVGDQARLFKRFMQILQPRARQTDSCIHFVNQQSAIIPQTQKELQAQKYATVTNWNYTLTGGKAARYFPSLMLMTAKDKAFEGAGKSEAVEKWLFPPQGEGKDKVGVGRSWDINKTKVRVLKNKINDGGYREHHIYIRPGGGIDDMISVRELAYHYGLIKSTGGGTIIGPAEAPVARFATQAEAIQSLVIEQNLEILAKLRLHVVDRIRNDDPRAFLYERSQADKYTAGETDVRPPEVTELDIDDDTLSADGAEDLGLDFEAEG